MQCIMDADGTLIDSAERHVVLFREITENCHIPNRVKIKEYAEYKRAGKSTKEFCMKVLGTNQDMADKISRDWMRQIETDRLLSCDRLYPDTLEFLNYVNGACETLCLLTARKRKRALYHELENLGIRKYFQEIYVVDPVFVKEEKKEVLKRLALNGPGFYVGDTEADYKAASEADFPVWILNRGFRSRDYLKRMQIPSVKDLGVLLKELKQKDIKKRKGT